MSVHPTQLRRTEDGQPVDAELHDDLSINIMFDAEELWAPERVRFLRQYAQQGAPQDEFPQSVHWSWALKSFEIPGKSLGPLSPCRMFGVRAQGSWQGLLLASPSGYMSRAAPTGRDLVYVKYVETAPWNWDLPSAGRTGRLKGVGVQLLELAVEWSIDEGFKGRVGLHALGQAESFYRNRCSMTDLGPDVDNQSMHYFEFTEQQAKAFLGEV